MKFKNFSIEKTLRSKLTSKLCILALVLSVLSPYGNSFAEVSFTKDVPVIKTAPTGKQVAPGDINLETLKSYTFTDLKKLSNNDLISTLENIQWYQIKDLFGGSEESIAFYNNRERVNALISAIEKNGKSYTSTNDLGLITLMEVLRAGFYLEFKNDQVIILKDKNIHDRYLTAVLSIQSNKSFALGTKTQDGVVSSVGLLLWDGKTNAEIINHTTKIVKQYRENMIQFSTEKSKETAVFNVMRGIEFDLSSTVTKNKTKNHPAYEKIDDFNKEIARLALHKSYDKNTIWAPKNALFILPTLGKYDTTESNSLKTLTTAMKIHPRLEEVYLYAAKLIVERYGSINYNGETIDIAHLKELAIDKYMPNTYTFDNGAFVIHAGNKIAAEKIKRLYWATNEVSSQFFRTYGWDKALEQKHKDDVLTIYLYNSPEEYKMNFHLNDIDPNNGGMYIEEEGVFYTYERTPEESRYTLEELFRHEYTHYLQARYSEKGFWWQTDLYANERLTWYDEGGAESFAGSTRTNGVVQRKTMVDYLFTDKDNKFNLSDTLHSSYSNGSAFYKYAYAFVSYLRESDKATFDQLNTIIKSDDVASFDILIKKLSDDHDLNTKFQTYMNQLITNKDSFTVPLVSDDYVAKHDFKASEEIYTDVTKSLNLKNVSIDEKASNTFNTFTLRGTYSGTKSEGQSKDWYTMDKIANQALIDLSKLSWSGYKTLTCYFVNHRVNSAGQFEYEVVFRGYLPSKTKNLKPVSIIQAPAISNTNVGIQFNQKGSFDPDGTIQAYVWNFGDGTQSTTKNPIHTYKKTGVYLITLTVTDQDGLTHSSTKKISVIASEKGHIVHPAIATDPEPNDDFKSAHLIKTGTNITGGMDFNDYNDTFTFEVKKSSNVYINLNNKQDFGIYWLLYNEKDLNTALKFPNTTGTTLDGSITLKPGKYYLRVYKYSNSYGLYNFTVNLK